MCFILDRGTTSITIKYHNSMSVAVMYILHCTSLTVNWGKLELNYHSAGDADYDIMSTACTMAKRRSVAVVGDDTDLLSCCSTISVPDIMSSYYRQPASST